ncbi:hypothetical protein [Streptomyces sp. NPDC056296]|uniref:hypothetical protein n=1 Tax=Streptomyces sp. NPDC056296 TaxID=3345775 RepID=UPI0035D90023
MTWNGRTMVITLTVVLAALLALAIAGFAFFAASGGESSGSDRKIDGAALAAPAWR